MDRNDLLCRMDKARDTGGMGVVLDVVVAEVLSRISDDETRSMVASYNDHRTTGNHAYALAAAAAWLLSTRRVKLAAEREDAQKKIENTA